MMTEMDSFSLHELEARARERDAIAAAERNLKAERQRVLARTVDTVRELHSRRYTDQQMADVLGVQRKVVNSMRLYGTIEPPKAPKASGTPALDPAG